MISPTALYSCHKATNFVILRRGNQADNHAASSVTSFSLIKPKLCLAAIATRANMPEKQRERRRSKRSASHTTPSSDTNASSSEFALLDSDGSGCLGREEIRAAVAARGLPSAHVQAFIDAADKDGDGQISASEFNRFCEQREEQLHSVFTTLDRNGDGRLTSEEIRAGCDALGVRVSHEQQRGLMQRLDANGDGGVSFDEFRSLLLLLPEVNPVAVIEAFQRTRTLALTPTLTLTPALTLTVTKPWPSSSL